MKLEEIELKESNSSYGGKCFEGETFKDFIGDIGAEDIKYCHTLKDFNELLRICGLLPLTKENYPNVEISNQAINELFKVQEQ